MRDPLEQWTEGETSAGYRGEFPGPSAYLAGEWTDYAPADGRAREAGPYAEREQVRGAARGRGVSPRRSGDSERREAVGDPVVVDGPLWRDEGPPADVRQPHGHQPYGHEPYGHEPFTPGDHGQRPYPHPYPADPQPPRDSRTGQRQAHWDTLQGGGPFATGAYGTGGAYGGGPGGMEGGPAQAGPGGAVPAAHGMPERYGPGQAYGAPPGPEPAGPGGPFGPGGPASPFGPGPYPGPTNLPPSRYGPRNLRLRRRPKRRHPVRRTMIVLLAAAVAASGGTVAWADLKLQRNVNLNAFGDSHPTGAGTNYLIVGSDSREGLSTRDMKDLHTGDAGGRRTDSMILMHKGASGTTMMSLPRDSYVTIPSYRHPSTGKRPAPKKNKLNAAFALGGPKLLIRTIEYNTGLRIDHYAEIGFAGFVNIVNSVGGVRMCVDHDIHDKKSGEDLSKGCHVLNGKKALAFVRQRHAEANGDLGRTQNQQKFLSALAHKAAKPHTLLNPSSLYPTVNAGLDTLVVDQNMGLRDLATMGRSMQGVSEGKGRRVNVPTAGGIATSHGSALRWNKPQARKLFEELKYDRPVTVTGK